VQPTAGDSESEDTGKSPSHPRFAYLDTGADQSHFIPQHRHCCKDIIPVRQPIQVANGNVIYANEQGILKGRLPISVQMVNNLSDSLVSVGSICDANQVFIGDSNRVVFMENTNPISKQIDSVINTADKCNLITLDATRSSNGLYSIDLNKLEHSAEIFEKLSPIPASKKKSISFQIDNLNPIITKSDHHRPDFSQLLNSHQQYEECRQYDKKNLYVVVRIPA
jgi:hypothetical protein